MTSSVKRKFQELPKEKCTPSRKLIVAWSNDVSNKENRDKVNSANNQRSKRYVLKRKGDEVIEINSCNDRWIGKDDFRRRIWGDDQMARLNPPYYSLVYFSSSLFVSYTNTSNDFNSLVTFNFESDLKVTAQISIMIDFSWCKQWQYSKS